MALLLSIIIIIPGTQEGKKKPFRSTEYIDKKIINHVFWVLNRFWVLNNSVFRKFQFLLSAGEY